MIYYRIYETLEGRSSLGYGLHGARWNHSGTPLIYAANSVALAMMELVSIKGSAITSSKWILAGIKVPNNLPTLTGSNLPTDWNARPPTFSTKDFGTSWALKKTSVALKVPSARIPLSSYPTEHNLLINPMHNDFKAIIEVVSEEEISFAIDPSKVR